MVAAGELAALRADGARRPEATELWRDQVATLQKELQLRERKSEMNEMKEEERRGDLRKELQEARCLQQQLQQQEELQMRKAQEEIRQARQDAYGHRTSVKIFEDTSVVI